MNASEHTIYHTKQGVMNIQRPNLQYNRLNTLFKHLIDIKYSTGALMVTILRWKKNNIVARWNVS